MPSVQCSRPLSRPPVTGYCFSRLRSHWVKSFGSHRPLNTSHCLLWWGGEDSNPRRLRQQIYSLPPLSTREPPHAPLALPMAYCLWLMDNQQFAIRHMPFAARRASATGSRLCRDAQLIIPTASAHGADERIRTSDLLITNQLLSR